MKKKTFSFIFFKKKQTCCSAKKRSLNDLACKTMISWRSSSFIGVVEDEVKFEEDEDDDNCCGDGGGEDGGSAALESALFKGRDASFSTSKRTPSFRK